jgi:hypothetical protein
LIVTDCTIGASETRQVKFFNVVMATSTAILACEYLKLFVATVATLYIHNGVFDLKIIMNLIFIKFFQVFLCIVCPVDIIEFIGFAK